jgi:rubrerythrin
MEFTQSETLQNLARSFAGESQARQRYTVYAQQARQEGQEYLARIFEETAANEQVHAEEFWEQIAKNSPSPVKNLDVAAGYPFPLAGTEQNLLFAAEGESQEYSEVYPAFAKTAREEGFAEIAVLWENIARIEGLHREVFLQAHRQLTSGKLYKKDQPTVWRCLNCGHVHSGLEPWQTCPVCGKPMGWVEGDIDKKQLPKN